MLEMNLPISWKKVIAIFRPDDVHPVWKGRSEEGRRFYVRQAWRVVPSNQSW
jgi:hypothetical protein